jgi:hypothetical protein
MLIVAVQAIPDIVLCVLQIDLAYELNVLHEFMSLQVLDVLVVDMHTQDKWRKTDALCVFLIIKNVA